MSDLRTKLQLRDAPVHVVNAPRTFSPDLDVADPHDEEAAILVFARDRAELSAHAPPAIEAARHDRLTWIAYPKAGQLGTDLNRDIVVQEMVPHGIRGVRQIAIDDVWSALRFRPA